MTAPNIVNIATIYGYTAVANVSTTAANVITNAVSSNKVFKVNCMYFTSLSGSNVTVTAYINGNSRTPTNTYIINAAVLPSNTTFVATDKNAPFYLEEGDSIYVLASANASVHSFVSYESIA